MFEVLMVTELVSCLLMLAVGVQSLRDLPERWSCAFHSAAWTLR